MSDVDQNSLLETPERLLRHECPLWIWEPDTGVFLWANSEGVKFWRESTLEALQARPVDDQHPAWITVRDELQKSVPGACVDLSLTFPAAFGGTTYTANCRRAKLHGKNAIIIEVRDNNYSQNKTHIDKVEDRGSFDNGEVTSSQQDFKPPPHSKNVDPHTKQRTSNDNEKSPLIPPPTNDETLFERPAKDSLIELARLINQVRIGGDQLRDGEDAVGREPPHDAKAPAGAKPKLEHTHDRPIIEEGFAHFDSPSGELPSIDMTELSGMRDQAELERIFDSAAGALAFTNGAQLIYANQAFASFFGYTDFRSLREDGLDWILPGQSDFFSTLLQTQNVNRRLAAEMRLRSGRRMSGVIDLTSVKVTRFGKIFLHLSLVAENTCENIGEHQANIHRTTQVEGKPQAITVDETSSADERSSLLSISQLAAISHEIRTPLNVISGFAEVMKNQAYGPIENVKYREYVRDIYESAQFAISLVNDMLDLSKLQAGKWEGNWQSLDVNDLVRSQVSLMRGMAANFRIRLSTTMEENLPRFQADERAVKQILLNLLSNAIKFTQAEGTVSVTTRLSRNGEIELIISDTGCGMTRSEIEQALTPFKQVNNEAENSDERSQPNGTGLGLPIAKALAEANKMGFHIASEKGQGVRVHLLIET